LVLVSLEFLLNGGTTANLPAKLRDQGRALRKLVQHSPERSSVVE
jgi:hypothetical protein